MNMDFPEMVTQEQVEELRELLVARLDEVRQSLNTSRNDSRPVSLNLSIGRLTRMDAMQQQQMASARHRRLEVQLALIEQALRNIFAGTYGACIRCEEPIATARLYARPESSLCMDCQGEIEK